MTTNRANTCKAEAGKRALSPGKRAFASLQALLLSGLPIALVAGIIGLVILVSGTGPSALPPSRPVAQVKAPAQSSGKAQSGKAQSSGKAPSTGRAAATDSTSTYGSTKPAGTYGSRKRKTSKSGATAPSQYPSVSLKGTNIHTGYELFQESCSACHGVNAQGTVRAPNLRGLGPATIDFWVSTGRMPLADPTVEPVEKANKFTNAETLDIAAYVYSLDPHGPKIPLVDLAHANLSRGFELFTLNCAGCHTITGAGDALSGGFYAPYLRNATPQEAADAIRTGPSDMPRFGPGELSPQQVDDIIAYVTGPIQHPDNIGGLGLGGVGPVAEGFIGLLIGVGGLMLVAYWIGDRT